MPIVSDDNSLCIGRRCRLTAGRSCTVLPVRFTSPVTDLLIFERVLAVHKYSIAKEGDVEYWLCQEVDKPFSCDAIWVRAENGQLVCYKADGVHWHKCDEPDLEKFLSGREWVLCRTC